MTTAEQSEADAGTPGLLTVAREWGRIGCVGFGGPPTHIALLRQLCAGGQIHVCELEERHALVAGVHVAARGGDKSVEQRRSQDCLLARERLLQAHRIGLRLHGQKAPGVGLGVAEADEGVDAVILTGSDPAFCAGVDFKEVTQGSATRTWSAYDAQFNVNPGSALNFEYFGLPTNTSIALSGNAAFTGSIYAPSAALTLGGGGSTTYDFVGSTITATVTMNGHFKFHYDESLARLGPSRGYVVSSWNEISPN